MTNEQVIAKLKKQFLSEISQFTVPKNQKDAKLIVALYHLRGPGDIPYIRFFNSDGQEDSMLIPMDTMITIDSEIWFDLVRQAFWQLPSEEYPNDISFEDR